MGDLIMNTYLEILAVVAIIIIIVGIIGYMITTNTIIREQEKEIEHLKEKLAKEDRKESFVVERKTPEFGGF